MLMSVMTVDTPCPRVALRALAAGLGMRWDRARALLRLQANARQVALQQRQRELEQQRREQQTQQLQWALVEQQTMQNQVRADEQIASHSKHRSAAPISSTLTLSLGHVMKPSHLRAMLKGERPTQPNDAQIFSPLARVLLLRGAAPAAPLGGRLAGSGAAADTAAAAASGPGPRPATNLAQDRGGPAVCEKLFSWCVSARFMMPLLLWKSEPLGNHDNGNKIKWLWT